MEKNDCTLQQEVDRIMLLDISSSEKNRMLSDLYCSTYMIMVSGLFNALCKPEMMSRVARLMHMQLISTSSSAKWGIVYFACKKSGCFVVMSYETFSRILQVTFGASLKDHSEKLVSSKTIHNGILTVDILLSQPKDSLKSKELSIVEAVETLAKNIAEICQA